MDKTLTARNASVECPFCGTLNRVDLGRLDDRPKCGSCGRPVRLDRPLNASDDTLEQILQETDVPVLVDFHADWCGPCRVMAPRLDDVARERMGHALVLKVDTDHNPAAAERYGIRSIPTMISFARGREVARHSGLASPQQLEAFLLNGREAS